MMRDEKESLILQIERMLKSKRVNISADPLYLLTH